MRKFLKVMTKLCALSVWHFISIVLAAQLAGMFISVPIAVPQEVDVWVMIMVSLLETGVMMWLASRLSLSGPALLGVLMLIFHGAKTFMMLMEAGLFLNLWSVEPSMNVHELLNAELMGVFVALIFCPVLMWGAGRGAPASVVTVRQWSRAALVRRIGVVGVLYALCYLLAGIFILIPLAGDSYDDTYASLSLPWWMPLVQVARGWMWALLILPVVMCFNGSKRDLRIGLGGALSVLGAAQLLYPNPYMLETLRYAHIIEIVVSMGVFGYLAASILRAEPVAR